MKFVTSSKVLLAAIVVTLVISSGCDGPFPSSAKSDVPVDHTVNRKGALHKDGLDHPLSSNAGCSDSDCHKSDLRGGLGIVEGVSIVTPSCYQCHGKKWDDGGAAAKIADDFASVSVIPVRESTSNQ